MSWWHIMSHISPLPLPPPPLPLRRRICKVQTQHHHFVEPFYLLFLYRWCQFLVVFRWPFHSVSLQNTGCSLLKEGREGREGGPRAPRPGKRWRFTWTSVNMWPDQLVYKVLEINTYPGCVTSCYTPDETVLLDHHIAIFKFFYLKMPL